MKKATEELIKQAVSLRSGGLSYPEIGKQLGKSESTVALYLNPDRMAKHLERAKKAAPLAYAKADKAKLRERAAEHYRANKDRLNAIARHRYSTNPAVKSYMTAYRYGRNQTDSQFRARNDWRLKLHNWWVGKVSKHNALMESVVGCTLAEFRAHLEKQFQLGQTWETYGRDKEWVIDHIRPLFTFDMISEEGVREAMHFTNVRPLHPRLNSGRERREKILMQFPTA